MSIENAKKKLGEAIYALKVAQIGVGHGPGAREMALAVTNSEQTEHWLVAAERARDEQNIGGGSYGPPSGMKTTNPGT